jgi:Ca2+-binding EF-hand superfamily protein
MPRLLSALCILAAVVAVCPCELSRQACAGEIDASRLFAQLDANNDGQLTADEAGKPQARLFARLLRTSDADSDGKLSAEEFATGLTPVRAEKDMVAKQGSRLPGGDALVVLVAMMDTDGNRQLTAAEIPQRLSDVFQQFLAQGDGDKNGRLDAREIGDKGPQLALIAQVAATRLGIDVQGELEKLPPEQRQAMEQMGAMPRLEDLLGDPKQARALFDKLDANGDKMLSPDEAPDGLGPALKRGDRDGDGKLSLAEFENMVRRMSAAGDAAPAADPAAVRRNVQQLLSRFDRNGNGRLGRKEAPPRMENNFDRLDKDGDGQLDADELQRAAAAMGPAAPAGNQRPRPAKGEEMQ